MKKNSHGIVIERRPLKVKKAILVKELDKTVYALAVRTCTDMVYDNKYKYTLTELLDDIQKAITQDSSRITIINEKFDALMKDCPEEADTLKKIWDYVNIESVDEDGNPTSALVRLIESKVDKEEGKGLSTNDFTDILYEKLVHGYSKEDLDEKFSIIEQEVVNINETINEIKSKPTATVLTTGSIIPPEGLEEGSVWFKIIYRDDNEPVGSNTFYRVR